MTEEKEKKRPSGAAKVTIVECLACFMSPTEVSKLVNQEFDLNMTRQSIEAYDPTKVLGKNLSKKLTDVFWDTRKAYLEATAIENIALAHQNVRLREYTELYFRAKAKGNDSAAAQFLVMAAKERGGLYTNKREHSGPNGGAIPIDVGSKRKELAAQMLRKLMDKGKSEQDARASLIAMGVNESDLPAIQ